METRPLVRAAVAGVLSCVDVDLIVLFGSAAQGRTRPDSDIDLLVVADVGERHRDVARQLRATLGVFAAPVDVHLVPPSAFSGRGPEAEFVRSVLADGVMLYQRSQAALQANRDSCADR